MAAKDFPTLKNDLLFTLDTLLKIKIHNLSSRQTYTYDTS